MHYNRTLIELMSGENFGGPRGRGTRIPPSGRQNNEKGKKEERKKKEKKRKESETKNH